MNTEGNDVFLRIAFGKRLVYIYVIICMLFIYIHVEYSVERAHKSRELPCYFLILFPRLQGLIFGKATV